MRRWLLVATLVAGARPLAPPRIAPPTLGVDYGLRRVGVCVGVGFASRPLEVIEHDEDIDAVVARLLQIARRERIASIVVGLPLEKDGAEGLQCAATRRFADALAAAAPATPLVLWDERFSSREAEALLAHRPGAALDAVAACVILAACITFAASLRGGLRVLSRGLRRGQSYGGARRVRIHVHLGWRR